MKKFDENGGLAVPRITVMPPRVVNVDNVPSLENVASQEIKYSPVTDASRDGRKCNFRHDDECGQMTTEGAIPFMERMRSEGNEPEKSDFEVIVPIPDTCCGIYNSEQGVVIQKIDTVEDGR